MNVEQKSFFETRDAKEVKVQSAEDASSAPPAVARSQLEKPKESKIAKEEQEDEEESVKKPKKSTPKESGDWAVTRHSMMM